MKKFLLFLILNSQLLVFNSFAQSPNWIWAKSMGGISGDASYSTAIDASGNVYSTGYFNGTADFDPGAGTFYLTTVGSTAIFISKLDPSGNFIWARAMTGTGYSVGRSIAVDILGNVYTTGYFFGTVDFNPGTGTFNLNTNGSDDIFISKLDSSGNFVWAKQIAGISDDQGHSISLDSFCNIYTTGSFSFTVDFNPDAGTYNLTSAGGFDIFISKLDSSGNFVWAKRMGGGSDEQSSSITLDASGSIYTTGAFLGTADFNPGAGTFYLTPVGVQDIFISKLDSSGNFVWAKAMGGSAGNGTSIKVGPTGAGDVYTTGAFFGTVDFDPGTGTYNLISTGAAGTYNIFISKLDSSGNFIWAKAVGGTGSSHGNAIAIDPSGDGGVYTIGYFNGIADFDPGVGVFNLTGAGGSNDIFISKLDTSGSFVWAKAMGGMATDVGNSIAFDAFGNAHVAGYFNSHTITFGSTTLINADTTGTIPDIFIAKLDTALVTGNNEIENFSNSILLFANPISYSTTISFSLSQSQKISLKIFDVNGRLVATVADKIFTAGANHCEWNVENINAGFYFLKIESDELNKSEKIIVTK